jgi:AcrR family transcriptional regulator
MARARRSKVDDSAARTALLDAAEGLMLEEGYAAVTSRRVAAKAGLNNGLVYYYFGTMDELFIELFRRGAERGLPTLTEVLDSPQPLWGMWELARDFSNNSLMVEFIALANHRKAIRAEIASYSREIRSLQVAKLTEALHGYGVDLDAWPPAAVIVSMIGISRFLLMEEGFDVDAGHDEAVRLIERHIRALEGEPRLRAPSSAC